MDHPPPTLPVARPRALAAASLAVPAATLVLGYAAIALDGSWGAIGMALLALLAALLVGAGLAFASLARNERWPWLAWTGLIVNLAPLLFLLDRFMTRW